MDERITLKGSRDGLRLILHPEAPWDGVVEALRAQLSQGTSFYQGAKLLIDIGERAVTDAELTALTNVMQEFGLEPEALITAAPTNRDAGRQAGIPARHPDTLRATTPAVSSDLIVWRTLRSGQEVRHEGHVVIVGDVNGGAEVIAGGSIIVWGRLRGTAHAGANGDASAKIYALEFRPTILRIADQIARPPDNRRPNSPEQASLDDGNIVVVPWDAPRR